MKRKQGNRQRQVVCRQLGRQMKVAGGKAGWKPKRAERLPNLSNYRDLMHGMGKSIKRVDPRRLRGQGGHH
jgi:hypothetical protein